MKNRAAITVGLIIILSAALIVKGRSCSGDVPELQGWYEPADEIDLKNGNVTVNMMKKDNTWLINEQAYPGDADLIESLERKARDFKLLDLVSDKGYYDKYDLTEDKGVTVTIKGKGKVLRKLIIGKSGSTNNHSYIKVDDRKEIFLASGIMKSDFTIPVSDLRNKVIFDVKNTDVKSFTINYAGKNFEFRSVPQENGTEKNSEKAGSKTVPGWICRGYENITLNNLSVNSILGIFSPLKAADFPENAVRKNAGNVICRVSIECADRKIELEIFSKQDKEMYYAFSSGNRYIFTLGKWQAEKFFIRNITDLAVKK